MSFHMRISAAAFALGLGASPALAEGFPGVDALLSGDYSHININHGGGDANLWGVSGTGTLDIGPDFAVQADGGYHNTDFSHDGSTNDWSVNGTAFWRGNRGRLGGVVGYGSVNGDGSDTHTTHYGGFGDWYVSNLFTLGAKGGGFNGSGHTNGEYLGAAAVGYVAPDIGITVGYDYSHIRHSANENDYSVKAEWLISERTPISIFAAYTNSKITGGGDTANIFSVGLTYYFDPVAAAPLVLRQRAGSEQWGTSFGPNSLKF